MKTFSETISCYSCYSIFELSIEVDLEFNGWNSEIYDCTICCNPNKIDYEVADHELVSLIIEYGND